MSEAPRNLEPNREITFKEITPKWVQGFRDYLENEACAWNKDYRQRTVGQRLAQNSRLSYFMKLKSCINQAYEERIIPHNPSVGIDNFKKEETTRMYLTLEEIKLLVDTPCERDSIKRAFLFSCLTGIRRSDIIKMTWEEVHVQSGFIRIIFRQKKTRGQEYLDITPQAAELMGKRGNPHERVFEGVMSPNCTNDTIKRWVLRAGIAKDITFHCARHTFAVLMLDIGTDIYTVSKLLGHRELSTTQIYARYLTRPSRLQ